MQELGSNSSRGGQGSQSAQAARRVLQAVHTFVALTQIQQVTAPVWVIPDLPYARGGREGMGMWHDSVLHSQHDRHLHRLSNCTMHLMQVGKVTQNQCILEQADSDMREQTLRSCNTRKVHCTCLYVCTRHKQFVTSITDMLYHRGPVCISGSC